MSRRRGRGINELVVGEVVNLPSAKTGVGFVVGGQRDGVGQADLLIAKYFEAGLDDDSEGVGAELATSQKIALVFNGDAVSASCVEIASDLVGSIKRGKTCPCGGCDTPFVVSGAVEWYAVNHRLALAYRSLAVDGHAVLDDGDADAEAALTGPVAADGAVEADDAVAVQRAVPSDGDVGCALSVDEVAALDAPEVLGAGGRGGVVGDRAALAGGAVAVELQGIAL